MKIPSLGILPVADAQPEPVEYIGICEASAAVALDEAHFVVASDETNTFQIYRRGFAKPVQALKFKSFTGREKSDIEAAARIGDRVYWISSFSRPKRGGNASGRSILVASRIVEKAGGPALEPLGTPFEGLRGYLKKELRLPGTDINIEGLAGTPEGDLLIGFRAPVIGGKAPVLRLKNPAAVTKRGEEPRFGKPQMLDLGGAGIRSIDWTGLLPALYLIVAGPEDDKGDTFSLYSWGGGEELPVKLPARLPGDFHAEALVVYPQKGLVQILSDDGRKDKAGNKIPKSKRGFRSIDVSY
ncbi:DUF3616 domain-containing protein [Pararhizobium sp. BT-229]|uniref:DUF3616 domain-containing protein n=1 Tax=Pararhizobium sp. BT-229 TaxID=2986923 RepID=UPI0021F6D6F1|nr:DUF3616 domain-containing protein [Pararhizobium sp. BT-229]MCV9967586.1 DUF3616 domain-containing protein [Pararhizobium sp. BT-229]